MPLSSRDPPAGTQWLGRVLPARAYPVHVGAALGKAAFFYTGDGEPPENWKNEFFLKFARRWIRWRHRISQRLNWIERGNEPSCYSEFLPSFPLYKMSTFLFLLPWIDEMPRAEATTGFSAVFTLGFDGPAGRVTEVGKREWTQVTVCFGLQARNFIFVCVPFFLE